MAGRKSLAGPAVLAARSPNALSPKDATRARIEKMEADRRARRRQTQLIRQTRAAEEERHAASGEHGDGDFVGLVKQWREEHAHLARPHDNNASSAASDEKICVCVRKRPLNPREIAAGDHDAVTCLHPTATVHTAKFRVDGISKYCDHNTFGFDHAFDETRSTEDVYAATARPLVDHVCNGGSGGGGVPRATVFAYGQTGSGKTHTMGGIQQMVAEDLFATLASNAGFDAECSLDNTTVSIAIFEIYGGRIQDLLNDRNRLKVLEDGKGQVVVSGLREFEAAGPEEFLQLIEQGHDNRTTHATEANDASSRSHAICQVLFRDRGTGKLRGKLSLVDLAGSERGSDTKSHNRQRRTESSEINTSLLALKECIRALDSGGRVPYRQSKLTLILKDCFASKAARTAMIATLSPGSGSADHTVNTLRYADRIKERKVGDAFAPSSRSPKAAKKSPVRKTAAAAPTVDERDDYDDDFDELDEILGGDEPAAADGEPQLSDLDKTVQEMLAQEEELLNEHMESIHANAELLTEEGELLQEVQGEDYDVDAYATRLGEILEKKTVLIGSLRDRLGSYRELLRKEEELSGLR
ncbi:hypothetical protein ACHAXT_010630 [Thalassiosira profunda]